MGETTAAEHAEPAEQFVLSRREGAITRITLNRPRVLNALTRQMALEIRGALAAAHSDGSRAVLLDGAGDRGFCGGGDIKAMLAGGGAGARDFLRDEYRTDYAILRSQLPVVGIMDGITMGGGIGLTGHASVRIVTERSRLAMPETRIGIVPDVGGSLLLAKAPGRLGDLLAAVSGSMTAGDAIALGFADYFVPSDRLDEFYGLLRRGEDPGAAAAKVAAAAPDAPVLAAREWFDPIAEATLGTPEQTLASPVAAAQRLVAALEAAEADEARALAAEIRLVSPFAVVVALAQLARVRSLRLDLAGVLADDFRVLGRLTARADFAEGVRAQVIDKDGKPAWRPATLEEVDAAEIARILDPELAAGETALEL